MYSEQNIVRDNNVCFLQSMKEISSSSIQRCTTEEELGVMFRNFALLQIRRSMQSIVEKLDTLEKIDLQLNRVVDNLVESDELGDPTNSILYVRLSEVVIESIKFSQSLLSPYIEKGILKAPFEQNEVEYLLKNTKTIESQDMREKLKYGAEVMLAEIDRLDNMVEKGKS